MLRRESVVHAQDTSLRFGRDLRDEMTVRTERPHAVTTTVQVEHDAVVVHAVSHDPLRRHPAGDHRGDRRSLRLGIAERVHERSPLFEGP